MDKRTVISETSVNRYKCITELIEEEGLSYAKTGELCGGISRQAVHQRYKKPLYIHGDKSKSKEIHRRFAGIAFLLSLGYQTKDVAQYLDIPLTQVYYVIKVHKVRFTGRRIKRKR